MTKRPRSLQASREEIAPDVTELVPASWTWRTLLLGETAFSGFRIFDADPDYPLPIPFMGEPW